MPLPVTGVFSDFLVTLGDGASPEAFTEPCGFTSKSLTLDAATAETLVGYCDTPEAIPPILRDKISKSFSIEGETVMAAESIETWTDAWASRTATNAVIELEIGTATLTITGAIHVTTLNPTSGIEEGKITMSVSAVSAADFTVEVT